MKKVREALEDDADDPKIIETLPRKGYRFIAIVDVVEDPNPVVLTVAEVATKPEATASEPELRTNPTLQTVQKADQAEPLDDISSRSIHGSPAP